jgi:hypothetical protein
MPSWDNVGSWSFDPLYLSSESPSPSPLDGIVENGHEHDRRSSAAIVAAASLLLTSSPAWADSPDWGLFEGRTGSLLHPVVMISMFALSASTALLGFQWKRQRTLGDEISALKKTMPDLGGAGSVGEALGTAEGAEVVDALYVRSLRGAMETEANVAELTRERKELANAGPRDKHFNQGALLLFVGTSFAIEVGFSFLVTFSSSSAAMHIFFRDASLRSPFITLAHSLHIPIRVASLSLSLSLSLFPSPPPPPLSHRQGPLNTYALAGNLFPGPHLYAGAALVVLWSLAAAMVPYMQKGSDAARAVHVGANLAGIGLFAWQVATGLHILFMVLELTKWP